MKFQLLLISLFILFSCKKEVVVPTVTSKTTSPSTSLKDSVESVNLKFNKVIKYGKLVDISGNIYQTVVIGGRVWMAENLRTVKFNNGDEIPSFITENTDVSLIDSPVFYWSLDPDSTKINYANLYTWYVVNDKRGICPLGWAVPTLNEWVAMIDTLGGSSLGGKSIKEVGFNHWSTTNIDATNSSGFTAVGSGYRTKNGELYFQNESANWWTSNEYFSDYAWVITTKSANKSIEKSNLFSKKDALSVRCIKIKT